MRIEHGVSVLGVKPEVTVAMQVLDSLYLSLYGHGFTLTSGVDGKHAAAASLHYAGCAFDARVKDLPQESLPALLTRAREALGEDFDAILETAPPHLHIEWQPKHGVNIIQAQTVNANVDSA